MQQGPASQRARGVAWLAARPRAGRSRIADLALSGSAKLLFPRTAGPALDAVFLNTAGGLTGGDDFSLTTKVETGATLRVTTQAAERAYRAQPDEPAARMRLAHTVAPGATLLALPQETILFDGAALDRQSTYELAGDAVLVACEALVFGRAAMGEVLRSLRLVDRIDIRRDGRLIFADRLRLEGDAMAQLARAPIAGGAGAVATVALCAPGAAGRLDALRALVPAGAGGLSAPLPDLVLGRLLAPDGFTLRATLVPLLRAATQDELPRPWML
jgi:urease accessory protein